MWQQFNRLNPSVYSAALRGGCCVPPWVADVIVNCAVCQQFNKRTLLLLLKALLHSWLHYKYKYKYKIVLCEDGTYRYYTLYIRTHPLIGGIVIVFRSETSGHNKHNSTGTGTLDTDSFTFYLFYVNKYGNVFFVCSGEIMDNIWLKV